MKRQASISTYFTKKQKTQQNELKEPPLITNNAPTLKDARPPLSRQDVDSLASQFRQKLGDMHTNRLEKRHRANPSDYSKLTPLESQVLSLKSEYPDCLLLIEVGYKFRFFGQDAKVASKVLHIAHFLDRNFHVASIPAHRLDVHVQSLVRAGYKVGIVRQTESAALKTDRSTFQRKLTQMVTKGTNMDGDTSTLLCLVEEKRGGLDERVMIGMVSIQTSTGDVIYDAFEDTFMRQELETRLLHIEPNEVLLAPETSQPTEKLVQHATCFDQETARIERFKGHDFHLDYNAALTFVTEFYSEHHTHVLSDILNLPPIIIKALACLLHYLKDFQLSCVFFSHFVSKHHMLLNGNTLTNLEIFRNNTDGSEKGSLFSVLNHTYTAFGKRLLRKWIGRPLIARDVLEARIEAVQELLSSDTSALERLLKSLPDLERGLTRIHYSRSSPVEVISVLQALHHVAQFRTSLSLLDTTLFEEIAKDVERLLSMLRLDFQPQDALETLFTDSDTLQAEKKNVKYVESMLQAHLDSLKTSTGLDVTFVTVAGVPYLLQVPNNQMKHVPHDWIKMSGTKAVSRFQDKEVMRLVKERERHRELLLTATQRAYTQYLQEVAAHHAPFRRVVSQLAHLDCLLSLRTTARQVNYVKPTFSEDAMRVVEGRHPMIEQVRDYVANDIDFTERTMVLTGPNMGGKSSYIRQVALIAILGQIGSYVPAKEARLTMVDAVYTRMGASDRMMRGESTFMVEMNETSEIMKGATERSLVILDELGRGTSTHDGQAIAYAVLTHFIHEVRCMTLFVTHYPSLGQIAPRNCHMSYMVDEDEQVVFLYRLVEGVAYHSFGMNVARLANIPASILEKARQKSKQMQQEETKLKLIRHVLSQPTIHIPFIQACIKQL